VSIEIYQDRVSAHFFKYCQWGESGSDQGFSYPLSFSEDFYPSVQGWISNGTLGIMASWP